ncbi:MAG TPA: class I SAM-dependent methyltransferase [Candidatus Limnocylindrales bacterium]|nr:class I SAM-dependent methyltransferase [Candidatus Limnocylindrales bacterium]
MTEQAERYDRIAAGYARWWAPIIAPAAVTVLDEIEGAIASGAERILDIGTGTGTLPIAILRRWPQVCVTAIDASAGMIEMAGAEADRLLTPQQRDRLELVVAFAADVPVADGSFDLAVSSFVLQLVPNRFRALREAHRALVPDGRLAYVTWLSDDRAFSPDVDFDAALEEVGIEAREWDDRPGDVPSVGSAISQLRRSGFADVRARAAVLEHPFDVEGYLRFMTEFDEEDLVTEMKPTTRRRFEAALRRRLERRPAAELVLRLPTVTATAIRR